MSRSCSLADACDSSSTSPPSSTRTVRTVTSPLDRIAGLIGDKPYDLAGGGSNYTPDGAFDVPFSKSKVLKAVGATGFIVS